MKTYKLLSLAAFAALLLLSAQNAFCVSFAIDSLFLYENGRRITDNSVLMSNENGTKVCRKGRCNNSQKNSTKPKFYKTAEPKLMNYSRWVEHSVHTAHKDCTPKVQAKARKVINELVNTNYGKSPQYRKLQERLIKAKTPEERKVIWEEWDVMKVAELEAYDIHPQCYFSRPKGEMIQYRNDYLEPRKRSALYKAEITLPLPSDRSVHNRTTYSGRIGIPRCFNIDIKQKTAKQISCP